MGKRGKDESSGLQDFADEDKLFPDDEHERKGVSQRQVFFRLVHSALFFSSFRWMEFVEGLI